MNHICLIDCNNFYASCETLFDPAFKNKPLVVVSGKGGIVIARSKEAKAIGIPMGAASFEYKSLFIKEDVIVRRTNFALYQDISKRIRVTVKSFGFTTFIYSIDEMFIQIPKELVSYSLLKKIQKKIYQYVGIEVALGTAQTKTLSKVATKIAKNSPEGIKIFLDKNEVTSYLNTMPVQDVWGIGKNLEKKLKGAAIDTAQALQKKDPSFIKKLLGVVGNRIQKELSGENSYPFMMIDPVKSIQRTKTFPVEIFSISKIKNILGDFINEVCEQLRKNKKEALSIFIFLQSSRFKEKKTTIYKEYFLEEPSNYPPRFLAFAESLLSPFVDGEIEVKRAGVQLSIFSPVNCRQQNLFSKQKAPPKKLMESIDAINASFGKNAIYFGSTSGKKTPFINPSKAYTSNWKDILEIEI